MTKTYLLWRNKRNQKRFVIALQRDVAKGILPKKQAIIAEETIDLDEEHGPDNGPRGKSGFRGTI